MIYCCRGSQEYRYSESGIYDKKGKKHNKITSHTLRHSFAMHWLQNGGSIEALSRNLAHNSIQTTEIYGEILEERANEEYQEYAPDIEL